MVENNDFIQEMEENTMEWKFVISDYYTEEIYADSTTCYNDTYDTDKEALEWANKYAKENKLKDYLIRIYRRNRDSDDAWELYSRVIW